MIKFFLKYYLNSENRTVINLRINKSQQKNDINYHSTKTKISSFVFSHIDKHNITLFNIVLKTYDRNRHQRL